MKMNGGKVNNFTRKKTAASADRVGLRQHTAAWLLPDVQRTSLSYSILMLLTDNSSLVVESYCAREAPMYLPTASMRGRKINLYRFSSTDQK